MTPNSCSLPAASVTPSRRTPSMLAMSSRVMVNVFEDRRSLPFRLILLLSGRLRRLQNSARVDCHSMLDLALWGRGRRAIDILYVRPRTDDSAPVKHTA